MTSKGTQRMTYRRGRSAGRRGAAGWLLVRAHKRTGRALISANPLEQCPTENGPHVAPGRPAQSPRPVVINFVVSPGR